MRTASFLASVPASDANCPNLHGAPPQAQAFERNVGRFVWGLSDKAVSDRERELHIRNCGYLMEDAMRRWCETGDFGYRGEADRWKVLMQEAIKARSPEFVAKLERERGLA